MATLLKVLNNLADSKSAGGVALRVRTQDALRDRDDWRSQAEHWKAQAQRLTLRLPAPRSAAERLNASRVPFGSARNDARTAQPAVVVALAQARRPQMSAQRPSPSAPAE